MATTRIILLPGAAHYPSSDFPALSQIGSPARPCLLFDDTTDETAYWTAIAWQGLSGALTAVIHYRCADATSGTAAWQVAVEAVGDGEEVHTGSFDTQNVGTGTVPGTTTYEDQISVTLTNDDSVAPGDLIRFAVNRDVSGDSVSNDLALLAVEIREA